jgi:hypothetical protein
MATRSDSCSVIVPSILSLGGRPQTMAAKTSGQAQRMT